MSDEKKTWSLASKEEAEAAKPKGDATPLLIPKPDKLLPKMEEPILCGNPKGARYLGVPLPFLLLLVLVGLGVGIYWWLT